MGRSPSSSRHFPIFVFAPPGVTLVGAKELFQRLRELRADTLVFTSDEEAAGMCTRAVRLPTEINELLAPIPYIIPAQLFAALLADAKGLDPRCPALAGESDAHALSVN